jgi:hypothetical protein
MTRFTRTVVAAGAATFFGLALTAVPAQAIPHAGPNQSVTFTYYSSASKQFEVGGWSYGYCGEPFEYGVKTRYYTVRIINC